MTLRALLLLGLVSALAANDARAGWVRTETGACAYEAGRDEVLRGPIAIVNGTLLPLRSAAGGLLFAALHCRGITCPVAMPVSSTVWGSFEGLSWIFAGVADTVSAGRHGTAPNEAARLRLRPTIPFLRKGHPAEGDDCP